MLGWVGEVDMIAGGVWEECGVCSLRSVDPSKGDLVVQANPLPLSGSLPWRVGVKGKHWPLFLRG